MDQRTEDFRTRGFIFTFTGSKHLGFVIQRDTMIPDQLQYLFLNFPMRREQLDDQRRARPDLCHHWQSDSLEDYSLVGAPYKSLHNSTADMTIDALVSALCNPVHKYTADVTIAAQKWLSPVCEHSTVHNTQAMVTQQWLPPVCEHPTVHNTQAMVNQQWLLPACEYPIVHSTHAMAPRQFFPVYEQSRVHDTQGKHSGRSG
ncbi:hypothetical protein F5Y08DRAFT_345268 [Xylaria arbuscula]|nr:hypothetical protein F5Y08DRAFT_345268 [Xylaria arbuscula]